MSREHSSPASIATTLRGLIRKTIQPRPSGPSSAHTTFSMAGLINWAAHMVNRGLAISDHGLDVASTFYAAASQQAILAFVSSIAKTTTGALTGYISPAHSVIKFIMSNPLNHSTFIFIRSHWFEVGYFLVDLTEPMKRFTSASSATGRPDLPDAAYNQYNELDMTEPMNVHAIISQMQRVILSLTALFTQKSVDISTFTMNTVLATDSQPDQGEMNTDVQTLSIASREGQNPETWLFVNGIAGEYFWTTLAVKKLADRFFESSANKSENSEIRGVFNRSDGILWDLVECAGERNTDRTRLGINESTASSATAQKLLRQQLETALRDKEREGDVVMVAHSQGCLILRLVLGALHGSVDAKAMRERLKVYTFGNPAFDWEEHAFVKYTEHFANKADFVAKLGVLRDLGDGRRIKKKSDSRYWCQECVAGKANHPRQLIFRNNERKGHLFGSQYSLADADYECIFGSVGQASELLSRP